MHNAAPPRYMRQRFLLALVAAYPDGLTATEMQKRMFLLTQDLPKNEQPPYSFFPYKYGCYSLLCARDQETLARNRWLCKEQPGDIARWRAAAACDIPRKWRTLLHNFIRSDAGRMSSRELVRHVYQRHPYYAINREKLNEVLCNAADREQVRRARPSVSGAALFTIGYEGRSFDEYVHILLQNDVKVLADVRANPVSRKPGFSKGTLRSVLPNAGIEYRHFPELGIAGHLRRDLPDKESRRRLFADYRASLPRLSPALARVYDLWKTRKRAALTCFEASFSDCHRGCIGEEMQARFADLRVEHL